MMEIIGLVLTNAGRVALTVNELEGYWYGYSPESERVLIIKADERDMKLGELVDEINRQFEFDQSARGCAPWLTTTLTGAHQKALSGDAFMQAFSAKGDLIMQEIDDAIEQNEASNG